MPRQPIVPRGSPPPLAPYSPGVVADNILYTSGMLAMGPNGETLGPGDIQAQTRAVLDAIEAVLAEAGGSLDDVVSNAIFLKDLGDYQAMNAVYKEYFAEKFPARYCIRADLVRPDFLVEIASVAHLPRRDG